MTVSFASTGAALGVEVRGLDLSNEIDDETFAEIRNAFLRHEVLIVRDCKFDDTDHIRFTRRFGTLRTVKMDKFLGDRQPEIFIVSNIKEDGKYIGVYDAGLFWHTDGAFLEKPHGASALHALEVPHDASGKPLGDTCFVSVTAAYEALPDAMKRRLEGLRAHHSLLLRYKKTVDSGRTTEVLSGVPQDAMEAVHPVVRPHPVTGAKCLYVSDGYTTGISGLPDDEGKDLLAELTAHCVKPEFMYRHAWKVHDLVMWDNHATQHKATFDYALPQRRLMHRTAAMY